MTKSKTKVIISEIFDKRFFFLKELCDGVEAESANFVAVFFAKKIKFLFYLQPF